MATRLRKMAREALDWGRLAVGLPIPGEVEDEPHMTAAEFVDMWEGCESVEEATDRYNRITGGDTPPIIVHIYACTLREHGYSLKSLD